MIYINLNNADINIIWEESPIKGILEMKELKEINFVIFY